jgi:hypothetical protein
MRECEQLDHQSVPLPIRQVRHHLLESLVKESGGGGSAACLDVPIAILRSCDLDAAERE